MDDYHKPLQATIFYSNYTFLIKKIKMNCIPILIILALLCFDNSLYGQSNRINFSKGSIELEPNIAQFSSKKELNQNEIFLNRFYRFVQFNEIPTIKEQNKIKAAGIRLLEYIPNKVYMASFPLEMDFKALQELNIRAIIPIATTYKLGKRLEGNTYPDWAKNGNLIRVIIQYHQDINPSIVKAELEQKGIIVDQSMDHAQMLTAEVSSKQIEELSQMSFVRYVDIGAEPGQSESDDGRHLHHANVIDGDYYGARNYDGTGVSVAVNDGGKVSPHIDFNGRTNEQEVAGKPFRTHSSMVAGIIGGAGNKDPLLRGMATGSYLHIRDYDALMPGTIPLHQDSAVLIFCSSKSNGCNAGYTSTTNLVDQEIYNNPNLMQVFSAGNSNSTDCGYGAGDQWGNITGGHKMGKNVIATANLNKSDGITSSSSRGPASDGRIKPDISAHGNYQVSTYINHLYRPGSGTSAAAPGVAGVMAQLHQAYRDLNAGVTAPSALLKAVLLNTANDLGNDGPDFTYGWGKVNALKAVQLLEDNRYFEDTIVQGNTNAHQVNIPTGVQRAKIMVYWADREASTTAATALVNDLDASVLDPSSSVHLPWLLSHGPNAATLGLPATKGADHLNNVEEIAIDNPTAGVYTLNVGGTTIPFGSQKYYVVYEFLMDDITVVHPIGGEGLIPGSTDRIHWDAYDDAGSFLIEYTADDGLSWTTIEAAESGTSRIYEWTVPSIITGAARIRISRGGAVDESKANFTIIEKPANLEINAVCVTTNTIGLTWDPVPGATGYDVFMLGNKYMDSIGTTTALIFDIPVVDINNEYWFSVRAVGPNGIVGLRQIAIQYSGAASQQGCYLDCGQVNDVGLLTINNVDSIWGLCGLSPQTVSTTIINKGLQTETNIPVYYQLGTNPVVSEIYTGTLTSGNFTTFSFTNLLMPPTAGVYELKIWTELANDTRFCNDTVRQMITVVEPAPATFPIVEDFESGVFPESFAYLIDANNDVAWETITVTGASGSLTTGIRVNNEFFNYGYEFREDVFGLNAIDLTSGVPGAVARLVFDASYHIEQYSLESTDDLRIDISTDCGQTFNQLYFKDGIDIMTAPVGSGVTSYWAPTSAGDWRNEIIDLSPYIGNEILLRFVNMPGHYGTGNALYLDNINVEFGVLAPIADFSSDVTYSCDGQVTFKDESTYLPTQWLWDFGDGNTSTQANPIHTYSATGIYNVSLQVTNANGINTILKNAYIEVEYPAMSSTSDDIGCQNESLDLRAYSIFNTTPYWYDGSNTLVHIGTNFTTPPLTTTTSYQVQSVHKSPTLNVGPSDPATVGTTASNIGYATLNFVAETDFELISVWVDANGAGSRTIRLWDGFNGAAPGNTLLETKMVSLVDGGQRVLLSFRVPSAGNYSLAGGNMDLKSNTTGVAYPYQIPDVLSIVSAFGGGNVLATTNISSYNFFYDWEVRLDSCVSPMVTVTANIIEPSFTTVVNANTVTFSDNSNMNPTNWFWILGDGSISLQQNPVHTYALPGSYVVIMNVTSNGMNCTFTDTVVVSTIVNTSTIIDHTMSWNIQPNPTTSETMLQFDQPLTEDYQVEIIGIDGRKLMNSSIQRGLSQKRLNVSTLTPAMYFVRLIGQNGIEVKKLLIQE